jgi:uncharacterized membrane protein
MNDRAIEDIMESARTNLHKKAEVRYYHAYLIQNHPAPARVQKYFAGSAVYSPVSYAPESLGIYLARTLRLPIILYVYAGRLFNAVAFIAIVYFAIRFAPRGKWALMAIAMLPTSLASAATISPDALVIGASLLLISLFIRALLGPSILKTTYLCVMLASIVVLALTKQIYFLFSLLPLFLPARKSFGSWRRYITWNSLFVLLAFGAALGWYSHVGQIAKYSYLDNRPTMHINSSEQITYLIHHPIQYAGNFLWQILGRFNAPYQGLAGILTWKGIVMPLLLVFLIYFGLLSSFIKTFTEKRIVPTLSTGQKHLSMYGPLILGFAIFLAIYTALYISFNPVGATKIEGVQGRYFVPLLGLILPAVILARVSDKPTIKLNQDKMAYILTGIFIIQSLAAILVVFTTNYIPNIQFV